MPPQKLMRPLQNFIFRALHINLRKADALLIHSEQVVKTLDLYNLVVAEIRAVVTREDQFFIENKAVTCIPTSLHDVSSASAVTQGIRKNHDGASLACITCDIKSKRNASELMVQPCRRPQEGKITWKRLESNNSVTEIGEHQGTSTNIGTYVQDSTVGRARMLEQSCKLGTFTPSSSQPDLVVHSVALSADAYRIGRSWLHVVHPGSD
mmetsp:Transcript_45092/g.81367  ORF Transcript_45092/g.81367 Transcript_45092/m.81367 type:complete len:209 (+) Transcript_45092:223-849(+)